MLSLDHQLPPDLRQAIYQLDEDATCVHEFRGVVQATLVAKSLGALCTRISKHGRWGKDLASIRLAASEL